MAQYYSKSEMFTDVKTLINKFSPVLLSSNSPRYSIDDCIVTVYYGDLIWDIDTHLWTMEYKSKGSKLLKEFQRNFDAMDFLYRQISNAKLTCKVVITTSQYENIFTKSQYDLEFEWGDWTLIKEIKQSTNFDWKKEEVLG